LDQVSNILKQRLQAGQAVHAEHPAADVLAAFVEHGLKDFERQGMLAHLATCPDCRQAIALAVPEMAEQARASAPSFNLQFPATMRWASLAAAVAVAIGVGVLSYEHETVRKASPATANVAKSQPVQPEQATDAQDRSSTKAEVAEAKRAEPASEKKALNLTARVRRETATTRSLSRAEAANMGLAGRIEGQQAGVVGGLIQPRVTESYLAAKAGDKALAPSQNETVTVSAAPVAPPLPQASSPSNANTDQNSEVMAANQTTAAESKSADDYLSQQGVVSGAVPGLRSQARAVPAKVPALSAVTGTMMKKSAVGFNEISEIVSWTITAAGKLQRQVRNGTAKLIEPAPGVVVRAVAARGIEVWAGGSQPDLSAKQWRQSPALFHSSDAGESWTKVDGPWHGSINQLTLVAPDDLTVVTDDGSWVSRDAGQSWTSQ
jgi:hypothetical protein